MSGTVLDLTVRISDQGEAAAAAREILQRASREQWALMVALAIQVVALQEQVDQSAEVYFRVVARE